MNYSTSRLSQALGDVQLRKYIVGSIDQNGSFSISTMPATHSTLQLALAEAERLARVNPGKAYVAMHLAGAKIANSIVSI
jgi:hypothetical protein